MGCPTHLRPFNGYSEGAINPILPVFKVYGQEWFQIKESDTASEKIWRALLLT